MVYLHGNLIACIGATTAVQMETLRRWPTMTTISRLRALGVDITTDRKTGLHVDGKPINRKLASGRDGGVSA